MKLFSNSIKDKEPIDSQYTCDQEDISPDLYWEEFPKETKSFALICYDPDSPSGNFVHWLMANIPANTTQIEKGQMKIPNASNLENDFGKDKYGGPCPGSGMHRYIFIVYALNTNKIDGLTKENFNQKISSYVIDKAQIIGTYQRKNI